ncbi:hypothetical protein ACA910_016041 [Epithemia clementina (nom. ined.)]
MGLSTAERNKRKRERKKKAKQEQQQLQEDGIQQMQPETFDSATTALDEGRVEIEYVAQDIVAVADEPIDSLLEQEVKRFQAKSAVVDTTSTFVNGQRQKTRDHDEEEHEENENDDDDDYDNYASSSVPKKNLDKGDGGPLLSKRKLRERLRPTVAELKRRVARPDLVEAHDITATDPDFLILLKAAPGTVSVPRHWGRKRKYLQGKRGFEKPPFQLPDFIVKTGITEVRDTVAEAEASMSAKQKNRSRVAPKMGAIDVDYRTLHDAFFKFQTKPSNLTKFGDLYYEGKELEVDIQKKSTGKLSKRLREALGMTAETSPPPWLLNMQRFGPPPSYPGLKIPGLNAPLPFPDCQYGFHPGGWGKPPVDPYGRPLYGGNPFDPPGTAAAAYDVGSGGAAQTLVTSDGKLIDKAPWGALPTGVVDEPDDNEGDQTSASEGEEEENDMQDSDGEDSKQTREDEGLQSILPPPSATTTAPVNLRKQDAEGGQTPAPQPKALYQVLDEQRRSGGEQAGTVFTSERTYAIPSLAVSEGPGGAESVISKALPPPSAAGNDNTAKRKRQDEDDDDDELGKSFKF